MSGHLLLNREVFSFTLYRLCYCLYACASTWILCTTYRLHSPQDTFHVALKTKQIQTYFYVGFEVLAAVIIKSSIFWYITSCSPFKENPRGWNLAVAKLTTVQVTKLPLQHKIRKIGRICVAKPVVTEDLYIVQKEEFSITCYTCDTYAWRKAKHIHKRQNHLLVREDVI
jgi:hypothetical protein